MRKRNCAYGPFLATVFVLFCCVLSGCAHTVSKEFRQKASIPVDFRDLVEKAEAHKGQRVILGGYVLKVVNEPGGTLLNVLQAPLDSEEKPKSADLSEGRFFVRTKQFLDPEVFSEGRRITVGGRVAGVRATPIGKGVYQYPVIDAEELHLLPKEVPRAGYPYPYSYWPYPWYPYPGYWPYPWPWYRY
jgi:outer membrane lipoprotein